MVETSDEWIVDRTGIRERRIAADRRDVGHARAPRPPAWRSRPPASTPATIDLIICATCSPDGMFPASASLIQDAIGARNAAAFDVNAACTGFLAALRHRRQFINAGVYERVLVVGAEVMSRIIDWTDRGTCVLFGDGAGAVLLEASERGGPASVDPQERRLLAQAPLRPRPASSPLSITEARAYCIVMDGREVFRIAVRAMEEVIAPGD